MKVTKSAVLVALAVSTMGVAMASDGGAGIGSTRHDFATRSNFLGTQQFWDKTAKAYVLNSGTNKVGLCSYCHTPHSATTSNLLWNRAAVATVYKWDDAGGMTSSGTPLAGLNGETNKGPSVKCLSCHDGSVAVGDVQMFKGEIDPGKTNVNTFKVGDQPSNYANDTVTFGAGDARAHYRVGAGGDLSGTHPVGVPYPLNNVVGTYNNSTTSANVVLNEYVANPMPANFASLTGGKTGKVPMIKLYTDNGGFSFKAGVSQGNTGIECSSCHDPHNKQTIDDKLLRGKLVGGVDTSNADPTLWRTQAPGQADGYICIQCHIK